ncbi:MAG: DUF4091 domain-containing protein [Planctomycetes bacterium]|nr:DUF4091 domain-containing protein [Planctomycetota bacterium]
MRCAILLSVLSLGIGMVRAMPAQPVPVPNPSFELGAGPAPEGWQLSGGDGRWLDADAADGRRAVTVAGDGATSNHWLSAPLALAPSALYRLTFRARRLAGGHGGGTPVSGVTFANRDLGKIPEVWTRFTSVFVTPADRKDGPARLRFGQWQVHGALAFDDVTLLPADAVHLHHGDLTLGQGESIDGDRYAFRAPFSSAESNLSRPLESHRSGFNTNRWTFQAGSEVVYCHELGSRQHVAAEVEVGVVYHRAGALAVEVSTRPDAWRPLGRIDAVGTRAFALPQDLLPAPLLRVRLHAEGEAVNLQVGAYSFRSRVDRPAGEFVAGRTDVFGIAAAGSEIGVRIVHLGQAAPGCDRLCLAVRNPSGEDRAARVVVSSGEHRKETHVRIAGKECTFDVAGLTPDPGRWPMVIELAAAGFRAEGEIHVPELHRTDYGHRIEVAGLAGGAALWWASSGWKIDRRRPAPEATSSRALELSAARNETEAVQLVIRAGAAAVEGLRVAAGPLTGPNGAEIPAAAIDVLRVAYVRITDPTDPTSVAGLWPDPLPPLAGPIDVPPGTNLPIWIRVNVPRENTPAGIYRGELELTARSFHAPLKVPLEVEVFDFALPDRTTCTTAFGFQPELVWRYHGLKTEADRRTVLHRYFENLSRHRISPYDPAPLDPLRVRWPGRAETDPAKLVPGFDWAAWDAALERAFGVYRFTSMRLGIPGLGGGTFHSRREPELLGHREDTPQYRALFTNYCRALETHLRERGWLDRAFVYWFDEPEPADYAFVAGGFRKLKEAAPGIARMLTEQPEEALLGGPNIWCPVSYNFDPERARERMAAGERLWWYVCTGPKAPYCTLFIDHPATEMRVWLWQTWERRISGILVWATNYWTSRAAYPDPDRSQNPYEDPMSWVSGYGTPAGVKQPWGNGDGRFLYPPEAAADGRPESPVLDGPVDSIRWEMLRDGIEDYEYLAILERRLGSLRADPRYQGLFDLSSVTRRLTDFTPDPRPLEIHRRRIAQAIAALGRE